MFFDSIGCPPGAHRADSQTVSKSLRTNHARLPQGHPVPGFCGRCCQRRLGQDKLLKTKVAEVHGNRTHRAHLPVNATGFEVQASHQARFTSALARL